jgi:NADPH-dependent curcumin reductase CurA
VAEINSSRIVLASRPEGEPKLTDFRLERAPIAAPREGELLLETLWLSLDPYMRGRMSAAKSYAAPVEIGAVMEGEVVARVLVSRHADYSEGDLVLARSGWQSHSVQPAAAVRRVPDAAEPVSTALGVLGMPGLTAYVGLGNIGKPNPGETVVVAAATGPVGSAVGQIARQRGARAVGIAGGATKVRALTEEFGFDAALDHRAPDFREKLAAACPNGIDVYFENVGGGVFDAVLPLLNTFARVPVCGLVAHYNETAPPPGPDRVPGLMRAVLSKRLTLRGFIVYDFAADIPDFEREMTAWVRDGKVRYREDVVDGLDNAPEAFIGLLKGDNFGKLVIRVAP